MATYLLQYILPPAYPPTHWLAIPHPLGTIRSLVFVISVVPFVADFLMVATYPAYMNDVPKVWYACKCLYAYLILRNSALAAVTPRTTTTTITHTRAHTTRVMPHRQKGKRKGMVGSRA